MSPAHDPNLLELLLQSGIDVRQRRIFMHGVMEQEDTLGKNVPEQVARGLLYLDKTPGEIELWVNTDGGYVSEMFALYDIIRTRQNTITTVANGMVASAGCLVLVAGDRRVSTENAFFMSHGLSTDIDGDLPMISDRLKALARMEDRWATLMASRTKKTERWWKEIHRKGPREVWLSAKQMVQYGVVDEILAETSPPP